MNAIYTVFDKHHENMGKFCLFSLRRFYTGNVGLIINYEPDSALKSFLSRLDIYYIIIKDPAGIPNEPSWDIVRLKPRIFELFEREMLDSILYLDADCIVCGELDWIFSKDRSMLLNERKGGYTFNIQDISSWGIPSTTAMRLDLNSGVVYLVSEDFPVLDRWEAITDMALSSEELTAVAMSKSYDQFTLHVALAQEHMIDYNDLSIYFLPVEYNYSIQLFGPPELFHGKLPDIKIIHLAGSDKRSSGFDVYEALRPSEQLYSKYLKAKEQFDAFNH